MVHEELTEKILGCAIAVHTALGPGMPEKPYQVAMSIEMHHQGIQFQVEPALAMTYRGVPIGQHHPDFIVEGKVVLEIKSVARFEPVFFTQVITYLKASGLSVGLLLNFNVRSMPYGIKRFINT